MILALATVLLAAAPGASAGTFTAPRHLRVDFDFTIVRANGKQEPKPLSKTWFFEVPGRRAGDKAMNEVLNRIFYDANVYLRRRQPDDHAWLKLVKFTTHPVDTRAMLAAGKRTPEAMPWITAQSKIVWEPGACFIVADDGRYDTMEPDDYTELVMNRLVDAKKVTQAQFTAFFDGYYSRPGIGQQLFADRAARMKNTASIRLLPLFRKTPGAKPIASGPVDAEFAHAAMEH